MPALCVNKIPAIGDPFAANANWPKTCFLCLLLLLRYPKGAGFMLITFLPIFMLTRRHFKRTVPEGKSATKSTEARAATPARASDERRVRRASHLPRVHRALRVLHRLGPRHAVHRARARGARRPRFVSPDLAVPAFSLSSHSRSPSPRRSFARSRIARTRCSFPSTPASSSSPRWRASWARSCSRTERDATTTSATDWTDRRKKT